MNSWLDVVGKGIPDLVGTIFDGVDKFVTTDKEKEELSIKRQQAFLESEKLKMQAEQAYIDDRNKAREMYMKDSGLQKVFAITFLIGYLGISAAMILVIFGWFGVGKGVELDAFKASLISMVFTAMSTKVATITDFLFGGSKQGDDSNKHIAETFRKSQGVEEQKRGTAL